MPNCPDCGFPYRHDAMPEICPKCDYDLYAHRARKPMVVDVAHRGETIAQALYKLEKAVDECLWNGHPSLKVIHGYGSGGARGRGTLSQGSRQTIRSAVVKKLDEYARRYDATLQQDPNNPGAHQLVFKE